MPTIILFNKEKEIILLIIDTGDAKWFTEYKL